MKVAKWGNSLALRLPSALVDILDLKIGDDVQIGVADSRTLTMEIKADRAELLERLRRYEGAMPKDFHFDRLEANEID